MMLMIFYAFGIREVVAAEKKKKKTKSVRIYTMYNSKYWKKGNLHIQEAHFTT